MPGDIVNGKKKIIDGRMPPLQASVVAEKPEPSRMPKMPTQVPPMRETIGDGNEGTVTITGELDFEPTQIVAWDDIDEVLKQNWLQTLEEKVLAAGHPTDYCSVKIVGSRLIVTPVEIREVE